MITLKSDLPSESGPIKSPEPAPLTINASTRTQPRLPIEQELAENLAMVAPENARRGAYVPQNCFWLSNFIKQNLPAPDALNVRPLMDLFLEPHTLDQAAEMAGAISCSEENHAYVTQMYRTFFGGVAGHEARYESMHDYYPDEGRQDTPVQNVFNTFFHDYPFAGRGVSQSEPYVRYDPERFLAGLAWLENHTRELSAGSPYMASINKELAGFIESEAYRRLVDVLANELGVPAETDYSKKIYREYWRDNDRSVVEDHYLFAEPGDRLSGRDYLSAGYLKFPEGDDRWSSEPPEVEPERLSHKISKALRPYRDCVEALQNALRRFEYVHAWLELKTKSSEIMCTELPQPSAELAIIKGRSAGLVSQNSGDPASVTPNNVVLGGELGALVLFGANGCGKTQLLSMIADNTLLAHRGLPVFASNIQMPITSALEYGVNLSTHSEHASSFQNEVRRIMTILEALPENAGQEQAVLILDEPFRGTDRIDAAPLIAGLIKYLGERGVLFACATHFNNLGRRSDVLEKLGARAQICTMNEQFEIRQGVANSEGIRVAEEFGMSAAILEVARQVQAGAQKEELCIETNPGKPTPYRTFIDPEERVYEDAAFVEYESIGMGVRAQVPGLALKSICAFSPLNNMPDPEPEEVQYCSLRRDYAGPFVREFLKPMTEAQRAERIDGLTLLAAPEQSEWLREARVVLPKFGNFRAQVLLDMQDERQTMQPSKPADRMREYAEISNAFFGLKPTDIVHALKELHQLSKSCPAALNGTAVADLSEGDFARAVSDFSQRHADFPVTLSRQQRELTPTQEQALVEWKRICGCARETLKAAFDRVADLNFRVTVSSAIAAGGWNRVNSADTHGTIQSSSASNTSLSATLGRSQVTLNDVSLDDAAPVQVLSGTNGGGKTQYLQLVGSLAIFAEKLGYVPAKDGAYGRISMLEFNLSGGEHSEEMSSFQNEVTRIASLVERFETFGCPEGALIVIDEPFKGTSEEDAAPLLIGLMKYFQDRGAKLVVSTHYSSVLDHLARLDANSKIAVRPMHVDYFSVDQRFKVRDGVGKSSGIRVAEELGLPREIIDYAREYLKMYS